MISYKKILLVAFLVFFKLSIFAQCAMCKAVSESDLVNGGKAAEGINGGIIYLMFVPYLLMAVVGYFLYKNYQNKNT